MSVMDNVNIDAVMSEDLAHIIEELGLRDRFERGECICDICENVINYQNIKLVFPLEDREIGFLCNSPRCLVEFALKE